MPTNEKHSCYRNCRKYLYSPSSHDKENVFEQCILLKGNGDYGSRYNLSVKVEPTDFEDDCYVTLGTHWKSWFRRIYEYLSVTLNDMKFHFIPSWVMEEANKFLAI